MHKGRVLKPFAMAVGMVAVTGPSFTYSADGTTSTRALPATSIAQTVELTPPQLPGSGDMRTTDRTGSIGPSGSEAFSISNGAVDAIDRIAKPAGDYAATDTDRDLAARIRVAVAGDPGLAPLLNDSFHLSVDNGVVTVLGEVWSRDAKEQIHAKVTALAGRHRVEDKLVIVQR